MVEVVPSILTNDPQELKELINRCEGQVDRVSIDIIDGHFVDNKTIDPSAMNYVDTNLRLDFQLMTKNPTAINNIARTAIAGRNFLFFALLVSLSIFVELVSAFTTVHVVWRRESYDAVVCVEYNAFCSV